MKTSTWHRQWVVGVYTTPEEAERLIRQAEAEGFPHHGVVVLGPDGFKTRSFAGVRPEPRHPEWRWMVGGAIAGFLLGSVGGHVLLGPSDFSDSVVMDIAMAFVRGFGGAVVGGMIGLFASGADTSLNAFYEESGMEGKIMVAIACDRQHPEDVRHAEMLVRRTGSRPIDFPQLSQPVIQ